MLYVSRPEAEIRRWKRGRTVKFEPFEGLNTPLLVIDYRNDPLELYQTPQMDGKPVVSGKRSFLIKPVEIVYRIKASAFNPRKPTIEKDKHDPFRIIGGQTESNMENEHEFSDMYNRFLLKEGIEPVMRVVGYFDYGLDFKGRKPVATIIEIKGDTRLDEFFAAIESRLPIGYAGAIEKQIRHFYEEVGKCAGSLVGLMHDNDITWTDGPGRNNSHIGNLVVFGNQDIQIGQTDFDSASNKRDFSESGLWRQKKRDVDYFLKSSESFLSFSLHTHPIWPPGTGVITRHRRWFNNGFRKAYDSERQRKFTVDRDLFIELCEALPERHGRDTVTVETKEGVINILTYSARSTLDEIRFKK